MSPKIRCPGNRVKVKGAYGGSQLTADISIGIATSAASAGVGSALATTGRAAGVTLRTSNAFCSFSADTAVLMADGAAKPIGDITAGDEVVATDLQTGEHGPREVAKVWVHADQIVQLEVDGGAITTTEDHPYWNATDRQWQHADTLDPGDMLLTPDGEHVTVVGIVPTSAHDGWAYNLTVNDILVGSVELELNQLPGAIGVTRHVDAGIVASHSGQDPLTPLSPMLPPSTGENAPGLFPALVQLHANWTFVARAFGQIDDHSVGVDVLGSESFLNALEPILAAHADVS